ncbi:kinase-like domain-containing protein [Xylaria cf. heliscus]|nr:kinase-like domain-containing protein [Xylaria cf. heliscus]
MSSPPDLGYFVHSDDVVEIEYFAEPLERYKTGCYYPICIGESLDNGRYVIQHKLGWGGYSTVWMAYDNETQTTVALKITSAGRDSEREYLVQQHLKKETKPDSGLVLYKETFCLTSPVSGELHRVFVFPPCGPNLRCCYEKSLKHRMSAAKCLLQSLQALHKAGIVHRDLNPTAVMWGMHSIDKCSIAEKYKYFGRPRKVRLDLPLEVFKGKMGELVESVKEPPPDLLTCQAYLGDFGISVKAGTVLGYKSQVPETSCAPERYHGADPSFASDMWSYMCIFAYLYLGFVPFDGWGPDYPMRGWTKILGPLPKQWEGRCDVGFIANIGNLYDQTKQVHPDETLRARLAEKHPEKSETERDLVLDIMMKVFRWQPESRLTADELLTDHSFIKLMVMYECEVE